MRAARALVFDFNGTLSHDEPVLYALYAELFAEHGRPLTEAEYFGGLAGNTEEAIIGGWLGVEGDELRSLVDERVARYRRRADGSTVPMHVREALRHAADRVPVGIVSGAYRREIEPVVEGAGLADAVTVLRCLAVRGTLPDERLVAADGIVDAIDVELVRSLVG